MEKGDANMLVEVTDYASNKGKKLLLLILPKRERERVKHSTVLM
jgi:hypothetical protein